MSAGCRAISDAGTVADRLSVVGRGAGVGSGDGILETGCSDTQPPARSRARTMRASEPGADCISYRIVNRAYNVAGTHFFGLPGKSLIIPAARVSLYR